MTTTRATKTTWIIMVMLSAIASLSSCNKEKIDANLLVTDIEFVEVFSNVYLELPFSFSADNPNFNPNDPATWTGNMAQYVRHFYRYSYNYTLTNHGDFVAYDTEIDLLFKTKNGNEEVKTVKKGDFPPKSITRKQGSYVIINDELTEITAETFWYN
ncbi:MAG: hypothetical protein ABF242_02125 [Flavobacteriales bacterium]